MTDYGELFRELAVPRLVGTPNHQKVREILKRELAARGYAVEEHAFAGRPSRAFFGAPRVVQGVNLIAPPISPSAHQPVWLVAHYDSKGQPIAMAVRLLGAACVGVSVIAFFFAVVPALILLAGGGAILAFNRVTDNSPGAVDNATALVAVLMTVDQLGPRDPVGVIFPDAEEFGLLGARALARERPELFAESAVVNLDGLDDIGSPVAFVHRRGAVGARVGLSLGARQARWLPVVVDGIVLAPVARECLTVMKGNLRTMRVVHRPSDSAQRVRLDGAAFVAAGLARVLRGV